MSLADEIEAAADPVSSPVTIGKKSSLADQIEAASQSESASKASAANIPRIEIRGTSKDVRPGEAPPISSPEFDLTANQATGLASTVAGGLAGIGTGLYKLARTGSVDQAVDAGANTVKAVQEAGTYQPRTAEGQKMIEQFGSNYNPLSWIPNASMAAGEKAGAALEQAGYPAAGAIAQGVGAAAPMGLGFAMKPLSNMLKGAGEIAPRVDPTMETPNVPTAPVAPKPAYKWVNGKPVLLSEIAPGETITPITPAPAGGAPEGVPTSSPPATVGTTIPTQGKSSDSVPLSDIGKTPAPTQTPMPTTPEGVQTLAQTAPAKMFPEVPTTAPQGGKFSQAEQLARARILESVGVDPNNIRRSAISGDGIGGSTDFQTAKVDSAAGRTMRAVLDQEKAALADHADTLVEATGGTRGLDQTSLYARGNTILSPLDAMKQWFDTKTSALYKIADERAQGVPTQLDQFRAILNDASERTNSDRVLLPDAVTAYAKKLGMLQEDGSFSGTAQQAETLRKYLNEKWSPQNSGLIGKLKDALDDEVMVHAGADIYGEARALRTQRANTLDNPNGISKLMDSSGPQGINRAVSVEKIADQLTGMPVDQFGHVVRTLKEAPPELQAQSAAALAEIKAQFANKMQGIGTSQQGQWNAKGVTKYLRDNAARMAQVFTPEEMGQFRNLNDAGHILAKDQSYPGAAVQGHNLMTTGTMLGLQAGGAAIGGAIGGPLGAGVGGYMGRAAASNIGNASEVRNVGKRMVKLSDLVGTK
jgi:hypothetical protein